MSLRLFTSASRISVNFLFKPILMVGEPQRERLEDTEYINETLVYDTKPNFDPFTLSFDMDRDIMVLPYSSGTTGLPKGVLISHTNFAFMHSMQSQ